MFAIKQSSRNITTMQFDDPSLEIATFQISADISSAGSAHARMTPGRYGILVLDTANPLAPLLDTVSSKEYLTYARDPELKPYEFALFSEDTRKGILNGFFLIVEHEEYSRNNVNIIGHGYWRSEDGEQIVIMLSKLSKQLPEASLISAFTTVGETLLERVPNAVRVTLELSNYYPLAIKTGSSKVFEPKFTGPYTYPVVGAPKSIGSHPQQILLAERPTITEEQRLKFERQSVLKYPGALLLVSQETSNNRELLEEVLRKAPAAFCYFPDLFQFDLYFLLLAIELGYFKCSLSVDYGEYGVGSTPYAQEMKNTDKKLCENRLAIRGLSELILANCALDFFKRCLPYVIDQVDFVLAALEFEPRIIKLLPETFPDYRAVARRVLQANLGLYHDLYSKNHHKHTVINSIVAEIIAYEGFHAEVLRNQILKYRDIAIPYFAKFPYLLEHCSPQIIDDYDAIKKMISLNGEVVLPYLSYKTTRDWRVGELVKLAVMENPDVYDRLPQEFREYLQKIKCTGPEIRRTIELAKISYADWTCLPKELLQILDRKGVRPPEKPAPKPSRHTGYGHSSLSMFGTSSFAAEEIKVTSLNLKYATADQQSNLYYVLACVSSDYNNIHFASPEMKSHPLIAYAALNREPRCYLFLRGTTLASDLLAENKTSDLSSLSESTRFYFIRDRIDTALLALLGKTVEELLALAQADLPASAQPAIGGPA